MTRLELATPTLARLCATNCATSAFRSRGLPRALVRHYPIWTQAQNEVRPARVFRIGRKHRPASGTIVESRSGCGRLAQLVARFLHTEEVISSSLVSPTTEGPRFAGGLRRSPHRRATVSRRTRQPMSRLHLAPARSRRHPRWGTFSVLPAQRHDQAGRHTNDRVELAVAAGGTTTDAVPDTPRSGVGAAVCRGADPPSRPTRRDVRPPVAVGIDRGCGPGRTCPRREHNGGCRVRRAVFERGCCGVSL